MRLRSANVDFHLPNDESPIPTGDLAVSRHVLMALEQVVGEILRGIDVPVCDLKAGYNLQFARESGFSAIVAEVLGLGALSVFPLEVSRIFGLASCVPGSGSGSRRVVASGTLPGDARGRCDGLWGVDVGRLMLGFGGRCSTTCRGASLGLAA